MRLLGLVFVLHMYAVEELFAKYSGRCLQVPMTVHRKLSRQTPTMTPLDSSTRHPSFNLMSRTINDPQKTQSTFVTRALIPKL